MDIGAYPSSVKDRHKASARLAAFLAASEGTTAVEFGLIALPLLFSILFLMSVGYTLFLKQGLDFAAQKAARQIRIGAAQQAQMTQAQFLQNVICPALPLTVSCSSIIVNISNVPYTSGNALNYASYMSFVNTQQTNLVVPQLSNSATNYCLGQGGSSPSYVYLQLLYPVPLFFAMFSAGATTVYNGQKVYLLMATSTFLNEPFIAPASAC
jgi:Flp pilus assembly protein TadG